MKNNIKTALKASLLALSVASAAGCSYGVPAAVGDKVVIPRQDAFLFGALRSVFVCKVTDSGLANCVEGESP
ncbi:MAG: hypothetical protein AAGA56_23940 [Myxococcota bacterium]